jgi:hypothetical protein
MVLDAAQAPLVTTFQTKFTEIAPDEQQPPLTPHQQPSQDEFYLV